MFLIEILKPRIRAKKQISEISLIEILKLRIRAEKWILKMFLIESLNALLLKVSEAVLQGAGHGPVLGGAVPDREVWGALRMSGPPAHAPEKDKVGDTIAILKIRSI